MKRDASLYLKDILDCIAKAQEFIGDLSYDDFVKDDKTSSAVVRKLEIIGEATKQLQKEVRDAHPELPWSEMAKMRDKIIHFYFGVDYEIVWKVVKERLPELKPLVEKVLKELEESNQSLIR